MTVSNSTFISNTTVSNGGGGYFTNSAGNWRVVEGWRGPAANSSRWWVHPKDFGTGSFRWLVMAGPEETVLKVSDPFYLPTGANETTWVTVEP